MARGRDRLALFGIRHHGPGSAHSLEQALEVLDPAIILVEGPPDADALLPFAAAPAMRPPLALLAYAADNPSLSVFYPFAEWSPEWRAILWAQRHGRPLRFIDLPAASTLAHMAEQRAAKAAGEPATPEAPPAGPAPADPAPDSPLRRDPLGHLAALAGYGDGEAWWNALVEQGTHAPGLFAAVEGAMAALRAAADAEPEGDPAEAERERRREAHMRLEIAGALKEVEGPVAVVCGAWHVPALRAPVKATDDRALLKGLPKLKAELTWVPWTDTRLAVASGYGAGVASPGWYRHLWRGFVTGEDGGRGTAGWQTRVAGLLRAEGQPASTASVIEAARLAEALAALRGLSRPGLPEMRDAALATLCGGEPLLLRLVEQRLVIGDTVGAVDEGVPQTPLQADLTRQQKRLRLKPEALPQDLSLDLRSEAGLEKSVLLHRLDLIAVPWGRLADAGGSRGSFRERWVLEWVPELSVRLVEALRWGTTIASAATARAAELAAETDSLPALAGLVGRCLNADLGDAARAAIARVQDAAVAATDVAPLVAATPPLAEALRYGTARRLAVEELRLLVHTLAERVCVGLALACRRIEEEVAQALRRDIARLDQALGTLGEAGLAEAWAAALARVRDDAAAHPLLRGQAARLLYDRGSLPTEAAATHLALALSPSVPVREAGAWLDGFLAGAGQLLLHDSALFAVVDGFLSGLSEEAFTEQLPNLRKAFSGFDAMERRRLLKQVGSGQAGTQATGGAPGLDRAAFDRAWPLLRTILGLPA